MEAGTGVPPAAMILHALALVLASAPAADATTLSVKVVSLNFSYPYFGEPGNTCQRGGSVYVHALADSQKPVVVRLADASGLTPGTETVLADVRRAGTGRDGTAVFCAAGRLSAAAPAQAQPVAAASGGETTAPPLVQSAASENAQPSAKPAGCTTRLFHIIKKPLGDKKFGPSEFDASSAQGEPEAVDCGVARARNTNVLLIKMVKDGSAKPETIVGAEWGPGSTWSREPDAPQRRVVKVYLAE